MNIKVNLNVRKLRDNLIDNTVNVLNKAKTKPLTPGQQLDALLDDPDLSDELREELIDKLSDAALNHA